MVLFFIKVLVLDTEVFESIMRERVLDSSVIIIITYISSILRSIPKIQ